MTVLQEIWQSLARGARRLYEAERQLVVHSSALTLILVFIFSVGALAGPLYAPRPGSLVKPVSGPAKLKQKIDIKRDANKKAKAGSGRTEEAAAVDDPGPSGQPPADQAQINAKPGLPPLDNTHHLDPSLLQRFIAFRQFVFDNYGQALSVRSGWRSADEQLQLFRSLPPGYANPPGKSNHEKGQAIDYAPYGPTFNRHLGQFGLRLMYPGKENWHVEVVEPH